MNSVFFTVPYAIGTKLTKNVDGQNHIDQVHKYVIDEKGISVILMLDVLGNPRLSSEIRIEDLVKNWQENTVVTPIIDAPVLELEFVEDLEPSPVVAFVFSGEFRDIYFKTKEDLVSYCQNHRDPFAKVYAMEYIRHFADKDDVIKIVNDCEVRYISANDDWTYYRCIEKENKNIEWELITGTAEHLYKPFKINGIVFRYDVYGRSDKEKNDLINALKKVKF